MTRQLKDIGASVRARLHRLAQDRSMDFQLLLTRYANERLLYRLSQSDYSRRFVLKGAALFTVWEIESFRSTRDLDFLGFGELDERNISVMFKKVLRQEVPDDGVQFDVSTITVEPIRETQEYSGMRLIVRARIKSASLRLQIDIGVGDAVTPEPVEVEYPTLLGFPAPRLLAYPPESVVAEKVEAIVRFGLANTRMKDFYDLVVLSRMFDFDGSLLVRAFRSTFERRKTPLPAGLPAALSDDFANDAARVEQWDAFVRRTGAIDAGSLPWTVKQISAFLARPLAAAIASRDSGGRWSKGGPWSDS